MGDMIERPSVPNVLRSGKFSLVIYAYRRLTEQEIRLIGAKWLTEKGWKRYPESGSYTISSIVGFDLE